MRWLANLISSEPVAAQWVLQASLNLAADFGLHLTSGQHFSILTLSAAILAFVTRQSVAPVGKPL